MRKSFSLKVMRHSLAIFTLPCLVRLSAARALWVPEELRDDASLWIADDFIPLARRDDVCSGVDGLDPCGNPFPSDFCCPVGAQCLSLNTTSDIKATLCCPAGQDCKAISPVFCDTSYQNATSHPSSQLHSDQPAQLEQCGSSCCPMGYRCQGSICMALAADDSAASPTASPPTLLPTAPANTAPASSTSDSTSGVTVTSIPINEPVQESDSGWFNGKSFAAGFMPGIALGALIAAGLILFMLRKERRKPSSYVHEKYHSSTRDTLTDLGPEMQRRPTVHGRSISEPRADLSLGHRTDFLKYTPPREVGSDGRERIQGFVVDVDSPPHNASVPRADPMEDEVPRDRGWLSRSPFMNATRTPIPTQSPVPAHLKRGTLSFQISPIRALKKQKSVHSLRRKRTDQSNRSYSSARRNRPDVGRSNSTETIKVLMETPEIQPRAAASQASSSTYQPKQLPPPPSAATWETTNSSSSSGFGSTPIEEEPNTYTPTRPGRNSNFNHVGATLSSPYTPSNYPPSNYPPSHSSAAPPPPPISRIPLSSLLPPEKHSHSTRDSTFSALMEKVGLRKTLLLGPDSRNWNK